MGSFFSGGVLCVFVVGGRVGGLRLSEGGGGVGVLFGGVLCFCVCVVGFLGYQKEVWGSLRWGSMLLCLCGRFSKVTRRGCGFRVLFVGVPCFCVVGFLG